MRALLQLTLDLFGAAPPSGEPAAPPPPQDPSFKPNRDQAPVHGAFIAINNIANRVPDAPAVPLVDALTPAHFVHPRANREARLGQARVAYEFVRGRRGTIGFSVGSEGLQVRAPRWVALRDVDAALQEKSDWILRKLDEIRQRDQRQQAARIEWRDGALLPFMGQTVVLRLDPGHGFEGIGAQLDAATGPDGTAPRVLRVALARGASTTQIGDAVRAWLMRQARQLFIERLDHFAPRLGVRWQRLSLSNASTRWGSASADGSVRLNWRLIHFRLAVIDYVVAHELAHLRVMDHSPRFWETVESVLPGYDSLRKELKDDAVPRW